MPAINIFLSSITIGCAVLYIALAIPLLRRRVKMNYFYGVRFKNSFVSDEAWYDINEYGARLMIYWSIPIIIAGIALLFVDLEANSLVTFLLAASAGILIVPSVVQSWLYSKKYSTEREQHEQESADDSSQPASPA